MTNYYNNDRKMEYLESQRLDAKDSNIKNIASVFNMTAKFESINDKDLCDFTFDEFLVIFNLNQWGNFATFKSKKTIIINYIKYCVSNSLCYSSSLIDIQRLSHEDIKNKSKFEVEYYKDFDDFHSTIQTLFNDGGQQYNSFIFSVGILYLLWYGFEKEEIIQIKNEDFDIEKRTITCRSTSRTVYIDNDEVLNMFKKIKKTYSIRRYNKVRKREYSTDYKNLEYLIKSERSDMLTVISISSRISRVNRILRDNVNMKNIYAHKKIKDYGISNSGLYNRIKALEESEIEKIKFEFDNVPLFNKLLNSNIPEVLGSGAYDFIKNYEEWKSFFYGE